MSPRPSGSPLRPALLLGLVALGIFLALAFHPAVVTVAVRAPSFFVPAPLLLAPLLFMPQLLR